MTDQQRIDAIESFLQNQFNYRPPLDPAPVPTTPPTPPAPSAISISSLDAIKTAGNYRLAPGTYKLTAPRRLPPSTTLDITGSSFEYAGPEWSGAFDFDSTSSNIQVTGGAFTIPDNRFIAGCNGSKNITLKNQTLNANGGWGYRIVGGETISLVGLTASTWLAYCVFIDGWAKNVTIDGWKVDGGSVRESCVRVCGCDGLTIRNSHLFVDAITTGARKRVAMRLHEGANYLIENVEVRGLFGVGPMMQGDGGQQWGTTQFIDSAGRWFVPKEQADMTRTLAQRATVLAYRTKGVRIKNVRIVEGRAQFNCGIIDATWDGGSITCSEKPEQIGWPSTSTAFYGIQKEYPSGLDQWNQRLPADIVRPAPDITVSNLVMSVDRIDDSGIVKLGPGNSNRGKAI